MLFNDVVSTVEVADYSDDWGWERERSWPEFAYRHWRNM